MALITPLLLLLLMGIIDFGRMLNTQIMLTEAAREGARAAALSLDPVARVQATSAGVETAVATQACPGEPGTDAVVVVTHQFRPITPLGSVIRLVGGTEDGSVTITATGVMPCVG
jgi:Flp pilus assembly protein TadG